MSLSLFSNRAFSIKTGTRNATFPPHESRRAGSGPSGSYAFKKKEPQGKRERRFIFNGLGKRGRRSTRSPSLILESTWTRRVLTKNLTFATWWPISCKGVGAPSPLPDPLALLVAPKLTRCARGIPWGPGCKR